MKVSYFAGIILTSLLLVGCATTRNNQADIDALNARLTALQGQMASKDQEIAALQNQVNEERLSREAAESALKSADAARRATEAKGNVSDLK